MKDLSNFEVVDRYNSLSKIQYWFCTNTCSEISPSLNEFRNSDSCHPLWQYLSHPHWPGIFWQNHEEMSHSHSYPLLHSNHDCCKLRASGSFNRSNFSASGVRESLSSSFLSKLCLCLELQASHSLWPNAQFCKIVWATFLSLRHPFGLRVEMFD